MRSQITFIMHPDDQAEFVDEVLSESGVVLVDGPKWETPDPPLLSGAEEGGRHLMIWNADETRPLLGRHHTHDGDQWWYCKNESLTLQFLRSSLYESFIVEGRIAVGSDDAGKSAAAVDKRYKRLRRWLKKTYTNGVLFWQNVNAGRSATNPGKPCSSSWVGPHAMAWLEQAPEDRWAEQDGPDPRPVRGYLVDLVG